MSERFLTVVSRRGESLVAAVEGGRLEVIGPVPVPAGARCAVSSAGWIVHAADEGRLLTRLHADAESHEQAFESLPLPVGYRAECFAFAGLALYVGGACGQEVLGLFDLREDRPAWQPLEVPAEFRKDGKAIDDLLVDGGRLIAVDDIVYPKYLLSYDIRDPYHPTGCHVKELDNHGTYERIHRAALGGCWVAILSGTVGMFGQALHVALLDRQTLTERGTVNTSSREGRLRAWHDVALAGDVLALAAGTDGVGLLDLQPLGALSGPAFSQACQSGFIYTPLPAGRAGDVRSVQAAPGQAVVLVGVLTAGVLDTLVLDVAGPPRWVEGGSR